MLIKRGDFFKHRGTGLVVQLVITVRDNGENIIQFELVKKSKKKGCSFWMNRMKLGYRFGKNAISSEFLEKEFKKYKKDQAIYVDKSSGNYS